MNIVTANKLFAFEDKTFGDEVEVMYDRTTTEIRLDHNINTSFWMQLNLGYIRNQYVSMRDPKPTVENLFFGSPSQFLELPNLIAPSTGLVKIIVVHKYFIKDLSFLW